MADSGKIAAMNGMREYKSSTELRPACSNGARDRYVDKAALRFSERPDQPLIFVLRLAIGVGGEVLQAGAIPDDHHAADGADEPITFEQMQGGGDTRPPHRQHQGDELMRQREFVAVDPVVAHQYPAGQPLIDLMDGVGQRGEAGLRCQNMSGLVEEGGEERLRFHQIQQCALPQAICETRHLDGDLRDADACTYCRRHRCKAVAAEQPRFDAIALRRDIDDRAYARAWEIGMLDRGVCRDDNVTAGCGAGFEMGDNRFIFRFRQEAEQAILSRLHGRFCHIALLRVRDLQAAWRRHWPISSFQLA
ncbi:hypothetical protein RHECNPAF_14110056 [Rhizobium etli CNPAF512]|nr:hypothetical protein RHECNPAF_14110056 [Rhizobium etli CNPAF512]